MPSLSLQLQRRGLRVYTNNNSWELAGINRAGRVNLFCAKQVPRLQDFEDVILVLLHGENLGGLVYRNPFAS
jgi:hypothetical protein